MRIEGIIMTAQMGGNLLLTMCDQAGIARVRLVPASRRAGIERNGASLSRTTVLLLGTDDSIADLPNFPAAHGDVRLHPDMAASRIIDRNTGLTWAPADQWTPEGEEFSVCQRGILRHQVKRLRTLGLEPVTAFEIEFAVYREGEEGWVLNDDSAGYGISSFLLSEAWMSELIDAFDLAGIPLDQVHPEYGHGQYEVALGVRDPVTAADDYVLARILIARVLSKHGLRPSFSPKPEAAAAGNGCHIHVSATTSDGTNIFAESEDGSIFAPQAGNWIGALVDELPDSIALLASGPHSYVRLQPGAFSGSVACWGVENREAAVRYVPGARGQQNTNANIEVKVPDCTSNPYLAVAAILGIGAHGIETGSSLPGPLTVVPTKAEKAQLVAARASNFPDSLSSALERLAASSVLREALGDDAIDSFVGVRSLDLPAEKIDDPEKLFEKYRWQQ